MAATNSPCASSIQVPLSETVDHEQLVIPCSTKSSDSVSASNSLVENGSDASASGEAENGSAGKKPAWNKPSKSEIGAVMGAETWPALAESARGSITISEKEAGTSISTPNSTSNHVTSMSQRSNGNLSQAPSRGNGSYHHHNHGVRRDPRRYFGTNQHRVGTRRPTPPPNAPFVPPVVPPPTYSVAIRPMVYSEVPPPIFYVPRSHPANYFRPMPMFPFSTVSFPMQDPHLSFKIMNQIDYYFSNENLVKDTFLRRNMDDNGWVSIKLIANFKRVLQLTDNIQLILDAIRSSNVVEVQGDKVRRKVDWIKWIIPQSSHYMLAAE